MSDRRSPVTYFNEFDPFAHEWTRNQYPEATHDARSITDVSPDDLAGFRRCHFFSGLGGWEIALRLAGWPEDREIWSGSCPCQPFSAAGKRKGTADERHLWPEFFRLIDARRPEFVVGEQVSSKAGLGWLDGVFADLEGAGYACWAIDTCAAGMGAPHIRQRLYWVAHASGARHTGAGSSEGIDGNRKNRLPQREVIFNGPSGRCEAVRLGDTDGTGPQQGGDATEGNGHWDSSVAASRGTTRLGDTEGARPQGQRGVGGKAVGDQYRGLAGLSGNAWTESITIDCRDGKWRRISPEPGVFPLAHGIPRNAGPIVARLVELGHSAADARRIVREARRNRVGRLRGYGNAIVPQCAVDFLRTIMDVSGVE